VTHEDGEPDQAERPPTPPQGKWEPPAGTPPRQRSSAASLIVLVLALLVLAFIAYVVLVFIPSWEAFSDK
jgi:hypothetical protein